MFDTCYFTDPLVKYQVKPKHLLSQCLIKYGPAVTALFPSHIFKILPNVISTINVKKDNINL